MLTCFPLGTRPTDVDDLDQDRERHVNVAKQTELQGLGLCATSFGLRGSCSGFISVLSPHDANGIHTLITNEWGGGEGGGKS